MLVQPYLFFEGRCDEALEFYRKVLGAEVIRLMRYKDSPEPAMCPSGAENKVMHAAVQIRGTTVMASDGHCKGAPSFQGFSLSIEAKDEADAKRLFDALSDGGQVQMPLGKTFFASSFGMVADKFGVGWMVIASPIG